MRKGDVFTLGSAERSSRVSLVPVFWGGGSSFSYVHPTEPVYSSIDFAGLARILTPAATWEEEPREVWFLTGAWLLGATMNAVMTWYAMVVLMTARGVQTGVGIVDQTAVLDIAPVFIAVMVWLTRVLLISSLALALERAAAAPSPAAQSRAKRHSPSGAPLRENGRVPLSANGHEG